MTTVKKAAKKKSAPKGAGSPAAVEKAVSQGDLVGCKNTSNRDIHVKGGCVRPGESGECTIAQLRQFRKFLEKT